MAKGRERLCVSCLYHQPYPAWEGWGICDCPPCRYYQRAVSEAAEPCEYYVPAQAGIGYSSMTPDKAETQLDAA